MSSKIIAIVFGVNFGCISLQQLGRVELNDATASTMADPNAIMWWLEEHIIEWIADNRFNPDEFPCMQMHVQLWNGQVLTAQHQHFYRVNHTNLVMLHDAQFKCTEFEERLMNNYFINTLWDVEIEKENFGMVKMQVRPSISVYNLIRNGGAKTTSFQLEPKLDWQPFTELPAIN